MKQFYDSKMRKYPNFWRILLQSAGFFILFTAYNPTSNIESKYMKDLNGDKSFESLGFINLATIQFFAAVGTIFSTYIIAKCGYRTSHSISALMIAVWILVSTVPQEIKNPSDSVKTLVWVAMIVSSAICGIGYGILWTVQGHYSSQCAGDRTKGFYFSIFWALYMLSELSGCLLAAFLIQDYIKYYFYIMSVISFASLVCFATLMKPLYIEDLNKSENKINYDNARSVADSYKLKHISFCGYIKRIFQRLKEKKMIRFLPQCAWTGISLAYYYGMLIMILTETQGQPGKDEKLQAYKKAMLVMTFFGVGEMIGGLAIGLIVDKFNNKAGCYFNVVIIVIMTIVTIIYLRLPHFTYIAGVILTFFWGVQDGALNIHSYCILGFEFESSAESFAVFNLIQATVGFIFEAIQLKLSDDDVSRQKYTLIIGFIGFICAMITFAFDYKETKLGGRQDGMSHSSSAIPDIDQDTDNRNQSALLQKEKRSILLHLSYSEQHMNNTVDNYNTDEFQDIGRSQRQMRSTSSHNAPDERSQN